MNDQEFFDLAYEEYRGELQLAYSLYQRAGLLMTAFVVIGAAAATISRPDFMSKLLSSWSALIALLAAGMVYCSVALGVGYLMFAIWPRTYPKLSKMYFWGDWRSRYRQQLKDAVPDDIPGNELALSKETLSAMLANVCDAQTEAAYKNQKRLNLFYYSIRFLAISAVLLFIQAVISVILRCMGV